MMTSSISSTLPNTTVDTLYTLTTSLEDVATDIEVIVGGILGGVLVIAVLLILLFIVLRRRKQQNNFNGKGQDEERYEEMLHPLEPDDKTQSVPDEVKKQIQRYGIDFLLGMSSQHEKYSSGIAQILKVPVELLRMSKEDIKTFVKNYKKGSTKVYCGRGMVVGCFGAGKTTLVKKLKGDKSPTESTRGLEVHPNIFTVDQDESGLTVNGDQKSEQRLYIDLECSESDVVKTSNPETNAETPRTTIPPAINESYSPKSTKRIEVHTNMFTENEDETVLRENKDQKSEQRFQMYLETLGSEDVKTSSYTDRTNPKADTEIPAATVLGEINYAQHPPKKHENEFYLPSQKMKTDFTSRKSNDVPSEVEQKPDKVRKRPVKHPVIDHITKNDGNKTETNQRLQGLAKDSILPNVSDKPVKTISLLDFAGQCAYYACHHIFLSPRTFYILLTDMSKKLTEIPTKDPQTLDLMYGGWTHQDYINHWLGSIHTYSSETAPVILVQSHSEGKTKKEENSYFRNAKEGVTKILQTHLRLDRMFPVCKESDKNMNEIKTCILSIVKDQSHWGESIPTSWVHLEACLMEIKKEQKVVKKKDLWDTLPSQIKMGIPNEEDMTTALKLFNDIGVLLFNNSSESIILDVQWFVDAFKNIITDEDHAKFDIKIHFNEWIEFSKNGILPKDLVKEIWIESESFTKHMEDLLLHMIRLGMIAKMETGEKFYVPCMNKQKYDKNVLRNCACSSTICFMFEYLPLVIFHRLIATCMTKDGWKIWNGNNMGKTGQTSECVFHTAAMLEDKDDLKMLIGITEKKENLFDKKNTYPYSIEIQGFAFKDQQMRKQFPRSKLERIKKHLKDLTSCFDANRNMTFRIGYRCSIAPFSDTPDSHIILDSAKECTLCRKTKDIDGLKSFWMGFATSENNTSDNEGKKHEKNVTESNAAQQATEYADKASRILDDTGLVYVATRLGAEWSMVVAHLGLKQAEIEQIQLDNPYNTHTQINTALRKWRDRQGDQIDNTLLQQLFTALENCDRTDLVEEMRQKYDIPDLMTSPETVSSPLFKPLLDEPRITATIDTGYEYLTSVSCLSDEQVLTRGNTKFIKLFNLKGNVLTSIETKSGNRPWDIAVTRDGGLVYTDRYNSTVNLVKRKQIWKLVKLQGWIPLFVYITASDDLLVTMISDDYKQSKVARYSGSTETQIIQFDDKGRPLYSVGYIKYITQNRNQDICVADRTANAVVVVNQSGKLRFRYTGHPSITNVSFDPIGITTDSQSHILTADSINHRIHILDQDGQFLRYIHSVDNPHGLCVDVKDNLFVAECDTAKVKKIQYLLNQR